MAGQAVSVTDASENIANTELNFNVIKNTKQEEIFMKSNKSRIAIILLVVILMSTYAVTASDKITAYISDFTLSLYYKVNQKLKYPIITYDDHAYISIRDMASLCNKEVEWNEVDKEISFMSPEDTSNVIKNEETAFQMGKAIANEYFSEYIGENTKYYTTYGSFGDYYHDDLWGIHIVFDKEGDVDNEYILLNEDAVIYINSKTGNIGVEKAEKGGHKIIVNMKY